MGTATKHPVPDRVKPSFVIFDIRALWRSGRIERQGASTLTLWIALSSVLRPRQHNIGLTHSDVKNKHKRRINGIIQ